MSLFDKNMSEEKRASLEFAEAARESEWHHPSFALKIFQGELKWPLVAPFPLQTNEEQRIGDDFLKRLGDFLRTHLNPDEVDRTGEIPAAVMQGLADLGAFAMKIPKEYGGLGLSQVNYNRAIHLISSYCGSTAVLLSAHQSIGVPQPLKLFGTAEQKKKFLPRFRDGVVSAFALTEPEAGSDPRNMTTTAVPVEEGKYFLINGEKLWCTNGPIAGILVVMAVTPPILVKGKERKQITAFIVETNTPGLEVVHRCRFMGLHGIYNGLIRFTNVKVPRENILLGEGQGLKLALMTLNTGRLTLPAASAGISKWCLHTARSWAKERRQWGAAIGEHESVALKLGSMAAHTFALDAVTWLTSAMADDKKRDIRLEAAIAKYFCTHHSWRIVDETLQIRGGQGYETADSLRARGMKPYPVERVLRDVRINLIIEGTSEIMHLFIAREALDPHLGRLKKLLDGKSVWQAIPTALGTLGHYLSWYLGLMLPFEEHELTDCPLELKESVSFIHHSSKRLARMIFHNMLRYQKRLESKQGLLNRIVDIGSDLFAMAASCAYAVSLDKANHPQAVSLAALFCREAQARINLKFGELQQNSDKLNLTISKGLLAGEFSWLENDIML